MREETQTSKVGQAIDAAKERGGAAFVGYLPVGFPDLPGSIAAAKELVAAGADVVEVGVPYSDPSMDGGVIQEATRLALEGGTRVADTFAMVEAIAGAGATPIVMTYFNLVFRYGIERFARDLASAGGAGLITPDLIPDHADEWLQVSDALGLDRVFLVAQSSREDRLRRVAQASRGFVYAASTMGVTGERASLDEKARDLVARTRAAGARRVCVGIGVTTPAHASNVASYADGVIVGSALIRPLMRGGLQGLRDMRTTAEGLALAAHGEEQ